MVFSMRAYKNLQNYFRLFGNSAIVLIAVLSSLALASLAVALPAHSRDSNQMTVLGQTTQPIGHYMYCQENPADCSSNQSSPLAPELTSEKWSQLVEINRYANKAVIPVTDLELYKKEEYWTLPGKYGDCEDYVLLKRQMLIDNGWPVSSLLVTVVKQSNGEGHAVLTVRTKGSDFILDNLREKILPWNKTEYLYLKRQSTLHAGKWSDIQDGRDVVGAIR